LAIRVRCLQNRTPSSIFSVCACVCVCVFVCVCVCLRGGGEAYLVIFQRIAPVLSKLAECSGLEVGAQVVGVDRCGSNLRGTVRRFV
jgi:hypothetical protein